MGIELMVLLHIFWMCNFVTVGEQVKLKWWLYVLAQVVKRLKHVMAKNGSSSARSWRPDGSRHETKNNFQTEWENKIYSYSQIVSSIGHSAYC